MKRSLALSGAIHALFFLLLLFGGLPRVEVSAPRAIQVLLLNDGRGDRQESAGAQATAGATPAPKAPPAATPRVARVQPERAARSVAWRARTAAAQKAKTAAKAPRVERVTIAAPPRARVTPGAGAPGVAMAGGSSSATPDRSSGADQPGSPAAGARVAGGSGGGAPSGEERDHRVAIIRQRIQEALIYPREARRRGIQGTSHVQFDFTDAGRLRTLVLARSSGKTVLDDASLETVQRAQPFPFVDGTLIVPVEFRLSGAR